ncbi:hypothetical protein ONS95_000468 [Cadophora gregata]|uniref:uncharacterized protein n=1 Tax=Cadophora gregata TaxID=51156 RepID=UPI0026DC03DD|nr:uncharacterized protein ONS95_000468 [Cadophora gregata]KAK0125524.1 hypothetical protein ONS96_009361 [Cadophora gregata f. sp. sojae]KAK0128496.1 hypothetical protein ONS95_000468 [Cadophora gregata]
MRKPTACEACRNRRRKCKIVEGQRDCSHCIARHIKCIQKPPVGGYYHQSALVSESRQLESRLDAQDGAQDADRAYPQLALRLELVQLYFDYIHNQFHTLFHPPSFLAAVAEDRVENVLLYPIFALSARFSTDPFFGGKPPAERGSAFIAKGESLLQISRASLTTIQACVLLGAAYIADGDDVTENVYYGIGCRMAQLLDLPNRVASSQLEHEINIRVLSSLCMVDVWSSTAVKLPKLMPNLDIPLPTDELQYLSLGNDMPLVSPGSDRSSPILAEMIKLNRILLAINNFNEKCVQEHLEGVQLEDAVEELSKRLDDWYEALPDIMRDTPENFAWFASHGLGRYFAAVYLGYYHFGQLLFYQFLHVEPYSSIPSADLYAEKCKHHAARLCEMIYRAFETPNSDVLYTMVAHVLVIASTVQIHTLLFSSDENRIAVSRARLERNFGILLHLKQYWSTLSRAMNRLRAFHDTCRKSMDTSFVLDRWMLRFLVEFAKEVEEKEPDVQSPLWTLAGLTQGFDL